MKYFTTLACIFLLLSISALGQKNLTISGYLTDESSGEAIIGAAIYIPELETGTTTNIYGYYSISLPPGNYTLVFSSLGFTTQTKSVDLNSNTTLTFEFEEEEVSLDEIVVEGERQDQNVTSVEMSVERLDAKQVEKMPAFLGEPDIINSLVLLPGVTNVGEGSNGFNVRGGNVDQNLILLDGAPIYNSSHLFGFFSVFNTEATQDVKLYKGGIPAEHGGRLSSVLEIHQKEGNMKKLTGSAGISSIASKATIEGPIIKDRMSFIASGRISYVGYMAKLTPDNADNNIYFYDANAKVNYIINEKNRIFLSGYFGNDAIVFGGDFNFRMQWGNSTTTFRWNHLFNEKLFSNLSVIYSNYDYVLGSTDENTAFDWKSKIVNYNLKYDFTYYASSTNNLKFGLSALEYKFEPGKVVSSSEISAFNEFQVPPENALELGAYISNEQKIGSRLTLQYGLRYSHFINHGAGEVYEYETGVPRNPDYPNSFDGKNDVIGSTTFDQYESIAQYGGFEPRASMIFLLNEHSSLKASYNRTRQYIHLITNTTAPLPINVWKPSGKYVEPSRADQVALGYFKNFNNNTFELSAEVYYKKFYDLVDYVDGAALILNPYVEQDLLKGNGRAYGLEIKAEKRKGKTSGWISYTLARTERTVHGINGDNAYPSNYDKPHDISLVVYHDISQKVEISGVFNYSTGKPITYPDGRYEFDGYVFSNFSNRNGARMPDFHRLDLSLNYWPKRNPDAKVKGKWNFSLFNAYGRRNAFSLSFRQNEDYPQYTEAYRISILGSPVPSVGYSVTF
ncbi:MAG: TonB-dependent receptor [Vicingaceae bacterium]